FCVEHADGAGGDKFIRGAAKLQVGIESAGLQRRAAGHVNPQCRKECFQVFRGHVLPFDLYVQDDAFSIRGNFICAAEVADSISDFQRGRLEDAAALAQVVFRVEVHNDRNGRGRSAGDEQSFGKFCAAADVRCTILRGDGGGQVEQAAQPRGGIEDAGGGKIQVVGGQLGIHRRERGVLLVQRTGGAVDLKVAAARKIGGKR